VKESDLLSVIYKAVFRDPGCLSQILFFPFLIQGDKILDPGSGSAHKNLNIFNPKKLILRYILKTKIWDVRLGSWL
jgi:hypothetical protein